MSKDETALLPPINEWPQVNELPDDMRVPLHSLQADLDWLFYRIRRDGEEEAGLCKESIRNRLSQIEEAAYRLANPLSLASLRTEPEGWVLVPERATLGWAQRMAEQRQGQSSTPRCEPPGDYQVQWAFDRIAEVLAASPPAPTSEAVATYQTRVHEWMMACFNDEIAFSRQERNHRFLEEALELVQAMGCTRREAEQLVAYTYDRPIGEPMQEVGGVMVCLAALCTAASIDMDTAGEAELARIWTKVEKIRAKHAAKPQFSPLPGPSRSVLPAPTREACRTCNGTGSEGRHSICRDCDDLPAPTREEVLEEIAAERRRQVEAEGWTPEHDDGHAKGEMAVAAACYALAAAECPAERALMDQFGDASGTPSRLLKIWPWSRDWWKPKSRRRDLIRAAALIVAEIERLDRGAAK